MMRAFLVVLSETWSAGICFDIDADAHHTILPAPSETIDQTKMHYSVF